MVLEAAEKRTRILLYFQPASFLFASRESLVEFEGVQEVDILQKLHKHTWDKGGNICQAAHDQPCPFSAIKLNPARHQLYSHITGKEKTK